MCLIYDTSPVLQVNPIIIQGVVDRLLIVSNVKVLTGKDLFDKDGSEPVLEFLLRGAPISLASLIH